MMIFRRKYFIYPEIQKPLMLQISVGLVLLSSLQALGVYLALKWMAFQVQADLSIVVDYRVLGAWKLFLYMAILVPIIFNIAAGLFIVLYISNRFAGPLFRLEREIDRYLSGETDQLSVKFRTTDYLHSLADKINSISKK